MLATQEALQLAGSYTGGACEGHAAGSAHKFTASPATFFGAGSVDTIKSLCEARHFQK